LLVPEHKSENAEFADKNGHFGGRHGSRGTKRRGNVVETKRFPPFRSTVAASHFPLLDRFAKGCKMKYSFELGGKSVSASWQATGTNRTDGPSQTVEG
jgi:hypothetical protein